MIAFPLLLRFSLAESSLLPRSITVNFCQICEWQIVLKLVWQIAGGGCAAATAGCVSGGDCRKGGMFH